MRRVKSDFFDHNSQFSDSPPIFTEPFLMPIIGRKSGALSVYEPYIPSLIDFSSELSASPQNPESATPYPLGWNFDTSKKQILLDPSSASPEEIRARFGYIASIGDAVSADTDSPFLVTVVAGDSYRFGTSAGGIADIFMYTRVKAFAPKSVLGENYQVIRVGMPGSGYLTPTDSKYPSAQLN